MSIKNLKIIIYILVLSFFAIMLADQKSALAVDNIFSQDLEDRLDISTQGKNSSTSNTSIISNIINTTAETGASGSGESSAEVNIKTEINGQIVEDIKRVSTSTGPVEIKINNSIDTNNDQSQIKTDIKLNDESSTFLKTIPVDASKNNTVPKPDKTPVLSAPMKTIQVEDADGRQSVNPSSSQTGATIIKSTNPNTENQLNYATRTATTIDNSTKVKNIFAVLWQTVWQGFKNIINIFN